MTGNAHEDVIIVGLAVTSLRVWMKSDKEHILNIK